MSLYKRITISTLIGLIVLMLSISVVSTITGLSLTALMPLVDPRPLILILSSTVMACILAFGDTALTGLVAGVLLVIILSSFSNIVPDFYSPINNISCILGIILGVLFKEHSILVVLSSMILLFLFLIQCGLYCSLIFLFFIMLSVSVRILSQRLIDRLIFPLNPPNRSQIVISTLVAFFGGYLLIIVFFALIYTTIFNTSPKQAFYSQTISQKDMSFWLFLYFSVITIATVGYGELVPNNAFSRVFVALEVLVGLLWAVVYFALLMRSLESKA